MGGLGLIFARYLASNYQAKLVLTGRSALSDKQQAVLDELNQLGGEAIYLSADVSDRKSVKGLVKDIKKHFGQLNGVMHAAGVLRDAFIVKKTMADCEAVIAPKVYGTLYLDEATRNEGLDFFVLFSSIAAVLGNVGQCDYAYANGFMDEYAHYRTGIGSSGKIISLNWPLWAEGVCRWMKPRNSGWLA